MKTYAIYPTKNVTIDGKAFTPEDQVGVASVDDISLLSLLGAIQFHHCKAVEIDEAEVLRIDDGDGGEIEVLVEEVDGEKIGTVVSGLDNYQPGEEASEALVGDGGEPSEVSEGSSIQVAINPTISLFTADGIDEKIATTLAEQGCTPDSIRGLIAEGFDLTELENIGKSRAAALLAVYGPKTE